MQTQLVFSMTTLTYINRNINRIYSMNNGLLQQHKTDQGILKMSNFKNEQTLHLIIIISIKPGATNNV